MIFMTTEELLQRVDQLIEMGNAVVDTRHTIRYVQYVDAALMRGFRSASLSFIQQVYGAQHPHYQQFFGGTIGALWDNARSGVEVLRAIRDEIAGGWLFTVKGRVTAEIFTDYMDMAGYLLGLSKNGKDPAAVIAGSTLEAHLRQLCIKNGIPVTQPKNGTNVPVKADTLNNELTKAGIYNMADQKQVTAWLDLRNKAAHGDYTAYTKEHIELMVSGVVSFIARNAV